MKAHGNIMEAPLGVVFDLDGTLLDTEPLYYQAYCAAAAAYGKPYGFHIHEHIIGTPDAYGLKFVGDAIGCTPEEVKRARDAQLEVLFRHTPAHAGAVSCVAQFKALGVPIAIATSSEASQVLLKRAANEDLFALVDTVVCGDDARIKAGKPAPDIFLVAAAEINIPPSRCWAFEDAPAGVKAAKAAGMFVFAIPDARISRDLYTAADVILDSIASFKLADVLPA